MPQQLTKDKNGRWVLTGADTQVEAQPYAHATPKPVAAKPQAKAAPKPWWHGVVNELKYGLKKVGEMNAGYVPTGTLPPMASPGAMFTPLSYRNPKGGVSFSTPSERLAVAAATVGAADNATKFGYSMYQRHIERKPKANPDAGSFGRGLNQIVDATYQLMGAKPPTQQNSFERGFDAFGRSVGLNAAVGVAEAPLLIGAKAAPVIGKLLANPTIHGAVGFGLNEALSNYLDDNRGGNFIDLVNGIAGTKLPGGVDVGNADMVDAANQSLLPNTAASLVPGAILGTAFGATKRFLKGSRTVEEISSARGALENAGLTQKAEDGRVAFTPQAKQAPEPATAAPAPRTPKEAEAGMQELINGPEGPKAGPAASAPATDTTGIVGLFEGLGNGFIEGPRRQMFEAYQANKTGFSGVEMPELNVMQQLRNKGVIANTQEEFNILINRVSKEYEKRSASTTPAPAAAAPSEALPDPWAEQHDPSLPEADVVYRGLAQLDDTELQVAAQQSAPVVSTVDAVIAGRPAPDLHPNPEGLAWNDITAPTVSLAPESIADYSRLKQDDLQAMVAVNPNLQQRIAETTGRDLGEHSRQDIIDALHGAAADGEAVIPRDFKQPTMRTDQINADPQRFQYKQGVNADGEQLGNSLSGVQAWNPSMEGTVDIWQDPADGKYFVVNGHNRLAKARALGVPTLKVNELMSPTAEAARAEGALSNMAQGSGTAFDAAKFLKDYSAALDETDLQAFGVPMKSGMAKQGLALSKLPDFAFQAAVEGELPIGKAVTLGESGLDEAGMTAAYKALKARDMGDTTFSEFLQIAKSAGGTEANGGQVDLFGNTDFVNTAAQKAELAASVRVQLASNKKLFGTVGRNASTLEGAGNTIDKAGAKAISGEAGRALTIFDQVKYETGPVSDLLNEGAARIANGEKAPVVAKQIQNRIANAIKQSMGADASLAGDVVQPDLMAGAAATSEATPARQPSLMQIADELAPKRRDPLGEAMAQNAEKDLMDKAFAHLSPAQREALRAQMMQKAIANGEVRPPETPIPALPDGPAVNLKAAADDLLAGTVKPGSPAAQAIADEVRLRAEYAQQDADIRWQQEQSLRDATNYEELTFDQKKVLGMADGFDTPTAEARGLLRAGSELYHGTTEAGRKGILANGFRVSNAERAGTVLGEGVYFTGNPGYAAAYGQKTVWGQLPNGAKILDLNAQGKTVADLADEAGVTGPRESFRGDIRLSYDQQQQVKDWATANGYDGIRFKSFDTPDKPQFETVIYKVDLANKMVGAKGVAPGAIVPSEVINPEVLPPESRTPIADSLKALLDEMRASDERMLREVQEFTGSMRKGLNQLQTMDFQLPRELSGSRTNWGGAVLDFGSDLDKTAYILAGDAKGASKRAAKFREAVLDAGINLEALVEHGKQLKKRIKDYAGTNQPSNASGVVSIPDQGFVDNGAPSPAIQQRAQARLEANTQAMNDIRRKAQQEGC